MKNIEIYKKKLMFRAWHRGIKELDLLIGTFAKKELNNLNKDELIQFERIINTEDNDLLNYFNGKKKVTNYLKGNIFECIKSQIFTPDCFYTPDCF